MKPLDDFMWRRIAEKVWPLKPFSPQASGDIWGQMHQAHDRVIIRVGGQVISQVNLEVQNEAAEL
jgi:hypothetical protein